VVGVKVAPRPEEVVAVAVEDLKEERARRLWFDDTEMDYMHR
jgi:hypothetical protein